MFDGLPAFLHLQNTPVEVRSSVGAADGVVGLRAAVVAGGARRPPALRGLDHEHP